VQSIAVAEWLGQNLTVIVYVSMAFVGGTTGHILAWEHGEPNWSPRMHVMRLLGTLIKAAFVCYIVFFLFEEYWKVPPPLCYVMAGLGSVFSSDFLRALYDTVLKKRLTSTSRRDPPDGN
jgi:peptidoglycan/LPS O-acetylase OafA/YrhL